MISELLSNPWVVSGLVAGFAVWAGAIWTVFSHSKFCKKWWWAALTLLSFTYPIPADERGWQLAVAVPIGAIYVLLFAMFGPRRPTSDRLTGSG